jgi:nucleoside-diphosphate-sugar epimerase
MLNNTALIAGATGLIGRRIAEHLMAAGGWQVIALARRARQTPGMRWIAVDLADADDCRHKLGTLSDVTHVFHAARYDHPEGVPESVDINSAMLRNLVTTLTPSCPLRHVHILQGSKYYGHQLGPVSVPLSEDSPRAPGQNFYFEQEDFLRQRCRGASWSYSASRPHAFCDPAADHPRSIGLVIAVYAAIQRELGKSLDFPGGATGYQARTQFTDLGLLARAVTWMAQEPRCANQAFNVVNGDTPRWSELWPRFAANFGLPAGEPRKFSLVDYMADKSTVWDEVVRRHALRCTRLDELVLWAYGDYQFRPEWDVVSSMAKARALGFNDSVDSGAMFARQFERYRAEKIFP